MLAGEIRERTKKGLDERGRPFAPLAASTIAQKGSSTSNLTDTGQMLDSLVGQGSENKIKVGLNNTKANNKARYAEQGASNRPQRKFLGFTSGEIRKLKSLLLKSFLKG